MNATTFTDNDIRPPEALLSLYGFATEPSILRIAQKCLMTVLLPLLVNLGFLTLLTGMLHQAESDLREELRWRELITKVGEATKVVYQGATLLVLSGESQSDASTKVLNATISRLDQLKKEISNATTSSEARPHVAAVLHVLDQSKELIFTGRQRHDPYQIGVMDSLLMRTRGQELMEEFSKELAALLSLESSWKKTRGSDSKKSRQAIIGLIGGAVALNVLGGIIIAVYLSRNIVGRVQKLKDNTESFKDDTPLAPVLGGSDEISELDANFHEMAVFIRESRHKERALVDNALDAIFSLDGQRRFIKVNPAGCALLSIEEQSMLMTKTFDEFLIDKKEAEIFDKAKEGMLEAWLSTQDDSKVFVRLTFRWSESDKAYFCVMRDVTLQKEAEEMKKQFVRMVSHDLRTPLTAIQCVLNSLSMGVLGELSPTALKRIGNAETEAERLIKLVNELLLYESLTASGLNLNKAEVNLATIVEHVLTSLNGVATAKSIELEATLPQLIVFADPERLTQIVINLVGNAIKYSPEKTRVKIEVTQLPDKTEVRIIDQGSGLTIEQQNALFEPFRRFHTGKEKGTGLGLAITKHLVDLHKGEIGVRCPQEGGSIFWFSIPARG